VRANALAGGPLSNREESMRIRDELHQRAVFPHPAVARPLHSPRLGCVPGKALPLMPNGASIILTASIVATKGVENFSVYSVTKAAVRSFARTWTSDLRARKIRINALSPGPIATPGIEQLTGSKEGIAQWEASMSAAVPLGRVGEPDEIAKAAVFLASDDSSVVTGIELFVDAGMAQI
jgi:NAD(P)-dependent dehydrogenase (short-subunit alcohol dehydrogenase family)